MPDQTRETGLGFAPWKKDIQAAHGRGPDFICLCDCDFFKWALIFRKIEECWRDEYHHCLSFFIFFAFFLVII